VPCLYCVVAFFNADLFLTDRFLLRKHVMAETFDYSNGSVVVQHGIIYYSPNCTRPVVIPPRPVYSSDPFRQSRLDSSMFKQPIWWSNGWAWLSFIPLSPSFVFTPFEPLCAMPRIEEVTFSYSGLSGLPGDIRRDTKFRMNEDDIQRWKLEEKRIIQVARVIQLRYGISCSLPPEPSSFHYDCAHKTHKVAKRMIHLSREWFAIWMGLLSYLIAKTVSRVPNGVVDMTSPAPDWYNHLRNEYQFSETWLDGLLLSSVCTFDKGTPRAGIIFQWSEEQAYRESIDWFNKHHIPLWFVWSNKEEERISTNSSLAYLRPPNDLIEQALKTLFGVPNIPLAGLVLQQFYRLGNDPITNKTLEFLRLEHAPSFVFEFTVTQFLGQGRLLKETSRRTQDDIDADLTALKASQENQCHAVAEASSSFPYHGLLASKRQGATWSSSEATWSSPEDAWLPDAAWPSTEATWPSAEATWPSSDASWPSADATWPSLDATLTSSLHLTNIEEKGKIYNHYNDFFAARKKRQEEMMKVETARDRQARESRARKPGVKNAKVYEWEKTQSSGGREVYKRVRVNKKRNEDVYDSYKAYQRCFNAFTNEWDLCHEFRFDTKDVHESDTDSDSQFDFGNHPKNSASQPSSAPSLAAPVDAVEHVDSSAAPDDSSAAPDDSSAAPDNSSAAPDDSSAAPDNSSAAPDDSSAASTHSRDPLNTLALVYGYVPRSSADDPRSTIIWDAILKFLGFVHNLDELFVPEPEKSAMMNFFCTVVSKDGACDMGTAFENFEKLFPFEQVQRPSKDLFVFSSPPSDVCHWVLGVHSPAAALYVCRYILENPHAHTILTVANRLLVQGIRFRTLLALTCSPRQLTTVNKPYVPKTYRLISHTFTSADFDVAMLACQSVLTSPQGRAALLRGGIVGRIAKEFLSIDGVLDGPSVEVTAHRVGYIAPSGNDDTCFCDDQLTDDEIAIICGTYSLYTGKFHFLHLIFSFLILFFTAAGQVAVWSWFPPPEAWESNRSGCNWLTWTERSEDVFQKILSDARIGQGKPKALAAWKEKLRGQKVTRTLTEHNESRSQAFMDRVVPVVIRYIFIFLSTLR
jgi:hypothetical protein